MKADSVRHWIQSVSICFEIASLKYLKYIKQANSNV